jgi:aminopeptidase N
MRRTAISICFLLIVSFSFSQRNIDVLHYRFEITISDNSDEIIGKATIRFKALIPVNEVFFDLTRVAQNTKGMIMISVFENTKKMPAYHANDSLQVRFEKPMTAGEEKEIIINYLGTPDDGLIISKNKFGKRTFFADNWPNRAHHWIPCIDDPADKATCEFLVTAPSHYKVVSNGVLTEETNLPAGKKLTHWTEGVPLPTKVMVIGVADFAVSDPDMVKGIPVRDWVFEENKRDGFRDYSIASRILSFMMNYIGPYPYKKLANVQSKTIFGGMENASAIFYHENSVDGLQDQETLFAHEIAHQWFGDMATEKNFAHLWLSEGFATYLSHIYIEAKYGTDSLNGEMKNDRKEVISFSKQSSRPVVDSVSPYMELLNTNSYQKGSWILHMLRRQLGDVIFRECIRKYYTTYAGGNADTEDLQKIFEEVSGQDLSVFFHQWLYIPEVPELYILWSYSEGDKKISVTITQLQKDLFQLPIEIESTTLQVSKVIETFEIPAEKKPITLKVDPDTSLLFEGTVAEIK